LNGGKKGPESTIRATEGGVRKGEFKTAQEKKEGRRWQFCDREEKKKKGEEIFVLMGATGKENEQNISGKGRGAFSLPEGRGREKGSYRR